MDVEIWSEFATKVRAWAANQDPSDKLSAVMLSLMLGDSAETDELRSTYRRAIRAIGETMDGFPGVDERWEALADQAEALADQAEAERLELLEEEGIEWDEIFFRKWKCTCGKIFLVAEKENGPFSTIANRLENDYYYKEPKEYNWQKGLCVECVTGKDYDYTELPHYRGLCGDCEMRYTFRKCGKCDEYVCKKRDCKQYHLCLGH
jgi:hypothetical protein